MEDADILIIECVHPDLSELFSSISKKRIKSTFLTHIPPELEKRQEEIIEKAKKIGIKELGFVHDGFIIKT